MAFVSQAMDKRKEKNEEVREAIIDAFFALMRKRENTEITVTDIVKEAGVARVSYYRNFSSREDIVLSLIDDAIERYEKCLDETSESFYCYWNIMMAFRMMHDYREYIKDIMEYGFLQPLYDRLTELHERLDGDIPAKSIKRYRIYAYIGAFTHTALEWIREGSVESPEELAQEFCRMNGIPIE